MGSTLNFKLSFSQMKFHAAGDVSVFRGTSPSPFKVSLSSFSWCAGFFLRQRPVVYSTFCCCRNPPLVSSHLLSSITSTAESRKSRSYSPDVGVQSAGGCFVRLTAGKMRHFSESFVTLVQLTLFLLLPQQFLPPLRCLFVADALPEIP